MSEQQQQLENDFFKKAERQVKKDLDGRVPSGNKKGGSNSFFQFNTTLKVAYLVWHSSHTWA